MASTDYLQKFVHELTNKYVPFFDVERDEILGSTPLAFKAEYKRRDERYMITKNIKIWSVENQQFVFVSMMPKIVTVDFIEQFKRDLEKSIQKYIPKHGEHMSSVFLGIIVTDQNIEKKVLKGVKRYRKVKFIKFGFHGWAEIYVAIVDIKQMQLFIHPKGRQFVKPIETMLREEI